MLKPLLRDRPSPRFDDVVVVCVEVEFGCGRGRRDRAPFDLGESVTAAAEERHFRHRDRQRPGTGLGGQMGTAQIGGPDRFRNLAIARQRCAALCCQVVLHDRQQCGAQAVTAMVRVHSAPELGCVCVAGQLKFGHAFGDDHPVESAEPREIRPVPACRGQRVSQVLGVRVEVLPQPGRAVDEGVEGQQFGQQCLDCRGVSVSGSDPGDLHLGPLSSQVSASR